MAVQDKGDNKSNALSESECVTLPGDPQHQEETGRWCVLAHSLMLKSVFRLYAMKTDLSIKENTTQASVPARTIAQVLLVAVGGQAERCSLVQIGHRSCRYKTALVASLISCQCTQPVSLIGSWLLMAYEVGRLLPYAVVFILVLLVALNRVCSNPYVCAAGNVGQAKQVICRELLSAQKGRSELKANLTGML